MCLFSLIKMIFKGVGYILLYTLPIIFCLVGIGAGFWVAAYSIALNQENFIESIEEPLTHNVRIQWDNAGNIVTSIVVREDLNWGINGFLTIDPGNGYFSSSDPYYYGSFMEKDGISRDESVTQVTFDYNGEAQLFYFPEDVKGKVEAGKFLGLYSAPASGGTQFVNGLGYSVRDVTMDMDLYAAWL